MFETTSNEIAGLFNIFTALQPRVGVVIHTLDRGFDAPAAEYLLTQLFYNMKTIFTTEKIPHSGDF